MTSWTHGIESRERPSDTIFPEREHGGGLGDGGSGLPLTPLTPSRRRKQRDGGGFSLAVVLPKNLKISQVGSLKQRLPGAAASSQLLWCGTLHDSSFMHLPRSMPYRLRERLGEMLPNDSTLEVQVPCLCH